MSVISRNENPSYPMASRIDLQPIMRQVYVWMSLGTLVTAIVAYITVNTPLINLATNPILLLVAVIAEFGLVLGISLGFNRISSGVAGVLFFAYAALNGFTLSMVLLAFTSGSVFVAFGVTAALFSAMSIIGYTTKLDLSNLGTYLMMGVIGLLIAMVVNMFVKSGPLDMIISIAGVLIFTVLTVYDTQSISRMAKTMDIARADTAAKVGILGALRLYLDFINMFLFVLRLMGRRR